MEFAWVRQGARAKFLGTRRYVLSGLAIASIGLLSVNGVPQLFAAAGEEVGVKLPLASVSSGGDHGSNSKLAFDRSTLSGYAPTETAEVIVELAVETRLTAIKLFGPSPYLAAVEAEVDGTWQSVKGLTRIDLRNAAERWNSWRPGEATTASRLKFTFEPQPKGNGSAISEVEIWGEGSEAVYKSPRALLGALAGEQPPEHATIYRTTPENAVQVGTTRGAAKFQTSVREVPESIKRAWLVYEISGIGHELGVGRYVNGHQPMGPLLRSTSSAWGSQIEQLDPDTLKPGTNTIAFEAVDDLEYEVRNVLLLIEQENGLNFVESVEGNPYSDVNPPQSVQDGDENSGWTPYFSGTEETEARALILHFDKPTQLEGLHLTLQNQLKGQIEADTLVQGEWNDKVIGAISGAKLMVGRNWIPLETGEPVEGLRLRFAHGEGSSAEIMAAIPVGSGAGATHGRAVNITYPTDGQYYGRTAYLRGFAKPVDNGSGTPAITIAGQGVENEGGRFEGTVTKDEAGFSSDADDAPWHVTITAEYPDGELISRELILDQYGFAESLSEADYREATPGAGVSNPHHLEKDEGVLDLDGDSMDESPDTLTITALTKHDLPPLNPGMTNVTRGPRKGYRFGPHGKKFKKPIQVKLPYDKKKLPPGMTEADIRTYYYDEHTGLWRSLERIEVDKSRGRIHSRTNHFTDMINATIVVPEHPEAASFNPTALKDIKAANPGAGIGLIEPPQPSNTGDAKVSYPIDIPPGRAGMQPQLAIQYSSGGQQGWLGQGWDLSVPSFSVETRWGVPRFDSDKESETYLYNGSQLAPVAHRGSWDDLPARSSGDKRFYPRVEGPFSKIIRHGTGASEYWWEVVDKNGTRNYFGGDGSTQKAGATIGSSKGVVRWMLVKSIDVHGNTVDYEYEAVCDTGIGKGVCDSNSVNGKQLYLSGIAYTGHSGGDPKPLYTIDFLRDSARSGYQRGYQEAGYDSTTDRRRDVQIDARGGFKQVTAERLWRMVVKYDDAPVRSYELEYEEGAFGKSLLSALVQEGSDGTEFNRHAFSYYDELPKGEQKGEYSIFEPVPEITTPDDELFTKTFTGQDFHQTLIGGTHGRNQGFNGFFGVGVPLLGTEVAGKGAFSANSSTSEGKVALLDVDGDGKPDKVFLKGGEVRYRKNITEPGAEIPNFDEEVQRVRGLTKMSRSSSDSSTNGHTGYAFGATGFRQKITTTSTDKAYFADVNGDGLIDHVNNGRVSFGYRDTRNSEGVRSPLDTEIEA
ncbi:SpvB/TcaC N-terminal domain-containing protein [Thiohalomonas denitrificans]|uniref:SpvB/TcaC N-terminal domain-containing protein n=1 Tax=Thiohalomonas denitrificans TaxID=415747 RepID=UPI0026EC011C|nr:SpvB/TcaC N-terminal domain-containing protein [Thiohalomonas denitrificans]